MLNTKNVSHRSSEHKCFETKNTIYAIKLGENRSYIGEEIIDQFLHAEHKKRFPEKN